MTHFRCTPCRVRLWRDGGPAEHLDDLCPGCGGPLEPVARTEELVGLRALRTRPPDRATVADHVRAVIAFHDAARACAQRGGAGDHRSALARAATAARPAAARESLRPDGSARSKE